MVILNFPTKLRADKEEEFVYCSQCIYYDECEEKEDRDGCYYGEREEDVDESLG